jgi:hypothetical protein
MAGGAALNVSGSTRQPAVTSPSREAKGQFKEMDNVGQSMAPDRRTKAKRAVKSGHGDQGDRKR